MSTVEHQATVDKGLKMKIKRKNVCVSKKDPKLEIVKSDSSKSPSVNISSGQSQSVNSSIVDKSKVSLFGDKSPPKSKATPSKKDKSKITGKTGEPSSSFSSSVNGLDSLFGQATMEPKLGETASVKKECVPDPYEFNAKVEDGIPALPMKKIKLDKEKMEAPSTQAQNRPSEPVSTQEASTDTVDMAVATEPDCLGPCEPGTHVNLEGIVWHESENGVLVVNVTWRGKTYVGTLLDATRHDWAPPRLNSDSPVAELESRTPNRRGKRMRAASSTPVNDNRDKRTLRKGARRGSSAQTFQAPPSPAKSDISTGGGVKRKGRPQDIDLSKTDERLTKRSRPGSQVPTPTSECASPTMLECPEPNCKKKYRHLNGLKYHQSHAHPGQSGNNSSVDESKDGVDTEDLPLSVVKNSVRKEKESNKKETVNSKKEAKDSEKQKDDSDKKDDKGLEPNADQLSQHDVTDEKSKVDNIANKKDLNAVVNLSESFPQNSTAKSGGNTSASQLIVNTTGSLEATSQISSLSLPSATVLTTIALPTIPTSALQGQSKTDKSIDIKQKTQSEIRTTKPNRPIIPAPSHPMIASVQVTHSNLTPVMTHAQVSPQLKPIQPKPTVMGETQNINPALVDLGKDKKKIFKKKSKESATNGNRPDQSKVERTGVIKTNPLPNKPIDPNKKDSTGVKDMLKNTSDPQRLQNIGANQNRGVDLLHTRDIKGASLLKVGSPLQVNTTPDNRKTPVNDDVQSPAYSDISDANESASPAANNDVSPQKQKDQPSNKKDEKTESNTSQQPSDMTHYGGMYYYGQSPYMNNMSPGQIPPGTQNKTVNSQHAINSSTGNSESKQTEEKKAAEDTNKSDKAKPEETKDSNKPKVNPPGVNIPPSNMSPQQMQEYQMQQQHQNWLQTQMYIQSLPRHLQYQYGVANGWIMDPAYFKQMMEEQRRMQMDAGKSDKDGPEGPGQRTADGKGGWDGRAEMKGGSDQTSHKQDESAIGARVNVSQTAASDKLDKTDNLNDKNIKEQALREKQNENHQILKENIDLKNEMDKNIQRQEEKRRLQMYKEQKLIEERKKLELARKGEVRPENLSNIRAPGTKPIIEHGPRTHIHGDILRDNSVKRDTSVESKVKEQKEPVLRDNSSGKSSDISKSIGDKTRPPIPDKLRATETPKNRPSGSSSKSGSPSSSVHSSSSVPGSPSYSPYASYASYVPPGHQYGHMAMEPNHPMYRSHNVNPALIGSYPPGNPYIHPSQLGYRVAPEEEKEKQLSRASPSDMDPKKSDLNRSQYYGSVHKIHELSEKGRPRSHSGSPGPQKPPPDANTSPYDKHRDREYTKSPPPQRHVHTHHHTHVLQPGIQPAPGLQQPSGFSPVYASMFGGQASSPHPFQPK